MATDRRSRLPAATAATAAAATAAVLILVPAPVSAGRAGPGPLVAAKKAQILCLADSGVEYRRKTSPRRCAVLNDGIFAGGVYLTKIRWKHWGDETARGRAIECGFHLPCAEIPAKVRASRPRERCGHLVYTRLKVKTRYGKATPRPAVCPGPT